MAAARDRRGRARAPHRADRGVFECVAGGHGDGASRGGQEMNYRLAYAIGFHPWEELAEHPPFADKLLELVARDEAGREPPYGPALDIGTGSGIWGAELAKRGWEVTGVDIADKALSRAPNRVEAGRGAGRLVTGAWTPRGQWTDGP